MKSLKDVKKIKERKIREDEKEKNEKISKRNKTYMYTIPLIIIIMLAIFYIPTNNNYLLIPFGIFFLIFLFGWDANQRTCKECKKWNSIIWINNKVDIRTTPKQKKNLIGKTVTKNERKKVTISTGKCTNCGKENTIEKIRRI